MQLDAAGWVNTTPLGMPVVHQLIDSCSQKPKFEFFDPKRCSEFVSKEVYLTGSDAFVLFILDNGCCKV